MKRRLARAAATITASTAILGLAGCGDDGGPGATGEPRLTVSAAASLKAAFEEYGGSFSGATPRFSFAGSAELAAQIRQGVEPDVYAAANTKLPDQLFGEGLVEKPVSFAGNRLVIAVAAGNDDIEEIGDLTRDGLKLAIGAESVPVGEYTHEVLSRLPADESKAILANVRSEEPDVSGVVGKLAQGGADAGFLYITDVTAAGDGVRAIELPESLRPSVEYGAAVVDGAKEPEAARRFVDGLLSGAGAEALRKAGFEPPPA